MTYQSSWIEKLIARSDRLFVLTFAILILAGTALLALPISGSHGSVGVLSALFTSTSAVCVTGLIVVDTAKDYSLFGQCVIMVLIQVGGLGISFRAAPTANGS